MTTLGETIRKVRLEKTPYDEREMAELLGISEQSYRRIESENTVPGIELLQKISGILGVPVSLLFPEPDSEGLVLCGGYEYIPLMWKKKMDQKRRLR